LEDDPTDRGEGRHGVVAYSAWETYAAVEAMRSDPRMQTYFLKIIVTSLDSIVSSALLSETR
jgi:hypothetical protein